MDLPKLKIRLYGDPCLRQKSSEVKEVGPAERMLITSMIETMYAAKGIGLAAPQVGINRRIFVVDIGEGPIVFVNPKILKTEGEAVQEEGCLSIPDVHVQVSRPARIRITYRDEENQPQEAVFDALFARAIQHENDHLDGRLIIDYLGDKERQALIPKLENIQEEA